MFTRSTNIIDFVCEITREDRWHSLVHALNVASSRQLWMWQQDALDFETSEKLSSSRTMAKALVGMIGCEATRRLGPKSADNPDGWEDENEEPETRAGSTQSALELC